MKSLNKKSLCRSLALSLVFLIFINFFTFLFNTKKVYANPLVGIAESELAPVIVSVLGSLGITVTLPTAQEYLQEEREFCEKLALESASKPSPWIQRVDSVKKGFLVSSHFVSEILGRWKEFCSKTTKIDNVPMGWTSVCIPPPSYISPDTNNMTNAFRDWFGSRTVYIPEGMELWVACYQNDKCTLNERIVGDYDVRMWGSRLVTISGNPIDYGPMCVVFSIGDKYFGGPRISLSARSDSIVAWGLKPDSYYPDKKFNSNVSSSVAPLTPKQSLFLPMPVVDNVSKVLDTKPKDVGKERFESMPVGAIDTGVLNPTPVSLPSDVSVDVPSVVGSPDVVGGVPWESLKPVDKPIDGTDSKPVDSTDSKPIDKPIDKSLPDVKIDFTPFTVVSENIKEVFPFCIPWDISNSFKTLVAPKKAPVFDINFDSKYFTGGGSIQIDLTQFESMAKIFRFFILLTFSVCIVLITRKVIGG